MIWRRDIVWKDIFAVFPNRSEEDVVRRWWSDDLFPDEEPYDDLTEAVYSPVPYSRLSLDAPAVFRSDV
jgi:hypothetical protein